MSHIIYVAAMNKWYVSDRNKLDTLICKSIKKVIGVPTSASTDRLLQLGVHNTLDEIIEAQETAQVSRLSSTPAGREILAVLGIGSTVAMERTCEMSDYLRDNITVAPFPKNVHPQHNASRRKARAVALLRRIKASPHTVTFVDAAQYEHTSDFVATVVNHDGHVTCAASIRDSTPARAEQAAIALALLDDERAEIFTDSRAAVRAFASGAIAKEAHRILKGKVIQPHTITWFPAHLEPQLDSLRNLNDIAHVQARELTLRADATASRGSVDSRLVEFRDTLSTFNEVTKHYYLGRRLYPPPHGTLTRPQAVTLRMLQTGSYPNLNLFHYINPDCFSPDCPSCGQCSTLEHMLWGCPSLQRGPHRCTAEEWSSALRSSDQSRQFWAV